MPIYYGGSRNESRTACGSGESAVRYPKQAFTAENTAAIPCVQVPGTNKDILRRRAIESDENSGIVGEDAAVDFCETIDFCPKQDYNIEV